MSVKSDVDTLIDWYEQNRNLGRIAAIRHPIAVACRPDTLRRFAKKKRGKPFMYRGYEVVAVKPKKAKQEQGFSVKRLSMDEPLASGLTSAELAERYRYDDDPGVRALARHCLSRCSDAQEEISRLVCEKENAEDERSQAIGRLDHAAELLDACQEILNSSTDLFKEINIWMAGR